MSIRSFFRIDEDHPFTGWHMLAVVLLFFGTIIAVNIVMVIVGDRHLPGPGRREQLRRQPELQSHPRRGAGAGRGRLADGARRSRRHPRASASPIATACRLRRLEVTAAGRAPIDHRRGSHHRSSSRTRPATAPRRRCRRDCGRSTSRPARMANASSAHASGCMSARRRPTDGRARFHGRRRLLHAGRLRLDREPRRPELRPARRTARAISISSCPTCIAPPASAGSRTGSAPCPASPAPAPTSPAIASGSTSTPLPAIRTPCSPRSRALGYSARPFDASAFDAAEPRCGRRRPRPLPGGRRLRRRQHHAPLRLGLVGRRRCHARALPLALGADRAAGDRLCRPAVLPLGAAAASPPAASTWTCRSRSASSLPRR